MPTSAQTTTGAFTERPSEALSRNLRSLAANPKSVTALMGAGKSALELGDAQAALTFFARAEEQLPRDGRVKMWIGSALVQLQQPHAALKFFRDATELGVSEAEVARDRGLARDIAGSPREAQRDYRLVLQNGRDAEVTRRLALSLAITGEREAALRLLEDQLLVRDRAAERTRALVLALTGDSAGATRAVRAAMPGPQAGAMAPFLARLPSLSPAQRALAVHLGVFPGDGRTAAPTTYARNDFADAVINAGRPDPAQTLLARRQAPPEPVSTAPRRRPGAEESPAPASSRATSRPPVIATFKPPAAANSSRPAARSGAGGANPAWAWSRGAAPSQPRFEAAARPKPAAAAPPPAEARPKPAEAPPPQTEAPRPTVTVATEAELPAASAETESAVPAASPETEIAVPAATLAESVSTAITDAQPTALEPQAQPAQVSVAEADPPAPAPQSEKVPAGSRLADLSAALADIAEPEPAPARATPARPKPAARAATTASAAAKPPPKKAKPAPPADPSRVWVQVAAGVDRAALPREYARLKAKAPKLLGARGAFSAPLKATSRLLIGPFATTREAQAFVTQLKAQAVSGFAWTSAAGQKVEKLPAR